MNLRHILISLLIIGVIFSCKKEDIDLISIEGVVRDDASKEPIAGIHISIDGIKSPSGMGIISDGIRETVGLAITDANGFYKVKLKVFKGAERLEFYLNPGKPNDYVDRKENLKLSNINRTGINNLDFTLSPTALLKLKIKNVNPESDSDFFYFGWNNNGFGWTKGIIQIENCGTIAASEALTWLGKDVCTTITLSTIAERYTDIYWTVIKNGITSNYKDSIFINRGIISEFSINY